MFTPATLFRAAVRHVPRLRPSVSVSVVASSSRPFSSTPAARDVESGDDQSVHAPLIRELQEADETVKARAQATSSSNVLQPRPFPNSFLEPSDFSMGRRIRDPKAFGRKFWKIGPSRAESEYNDVFRQLDIDPLKEAMNSRLLFSFTSELGKIPSRAETRLTWRSQRKMGKAIRRAKMMGIIPLHSRRMLRQDKGMRENP